MNLIEIDQLANLNFKGIVTTDSAISRLISKNYSNESGFKYSFSDDLKICNIVIEAATIKQSSFKSIDIIFRSDSISNYRIYEQYDDILKQYAYSLNF